MARRLPCDIHRKPARVEAPVRLSVSRAGGHGEPVGAKTHSDRLVEDEAIDALRPLCPADEAINSKRQTGVQREKRSTPLARPGVQREKDQRQTPTAGLDRGRRDTSTPSIRSVLLAESYVKSAAAAFPHGRPSGERIIRQVRPGQQGSRPQVSMAGNLGKSLTTQPLSPLRNRNERACRPPPANCRQIVH